MNAQEIAITLKGIIAGLTGRKDQDLHYLEQMSVNDGRADAAYLCGFLKRHTKNWHEGIGDDTYFGHITTECQAYIGYVLWSELS